MSLYDNFIGGEWVPSDERLENRNPADLSDVIGEYAQATAAEVDKATEAAAGIQPTWMRAPIQERHDLLDAAGNLILERKNDLGRLLSREEGKTLPEAVAECERAGRIFKFFAGEALRARGNAVPSVRPGIDVETARQPVGVVGLITPWNFPIAIPAWKTAPALAFGNAVVLKPAELTPGCAWALAAILEEVGLPDGVFNLLMGSGPVVGGALLEHPGIDAVSFTGSVKTGRHVAVKCAETQKKVQLEMGGKNPMVVLDDADLDRAVSGCINGAFYSTGQRCTASSRLIVTERIHDAFVERMVADMRALSVGDPLNPDTQIGPVIDEIQLESNIRYVTLAGEEGAEVVGGERLSLEKNGYFQAPALFLGATNEMRTSREEIFGPCASVIKVSDFDAAVAVANDTDFGLVSGICTSSLKYATEFKRQSRSGMVMVNLPTAGVDYHVPFGGRRNSSYGPQEQGYSAIEFYTDLKTTYTSP